MERKARIVATLGPASNTEPVIAKLIEAGVDVVRLNMSHGDHESQKRTFAAVHKASESVGKYVPILMDLQGPKIRFGVFPRGPHELASGQSFTISTAGSQEGNSERGWCGFAGLASEVSRGDVILVNDGLIRLKVEGVEGSEIHTLVEVGGPLSDRKGINLPGLKLSTPAVTEKDARDLSLALSLGADMVAVSFVREAKDLDPVRAEIDKSNMRTQIIAKIEKPQALKNFEAILDKADGIMVARGDLGVEIPAEQVPGMQKRLITQVNAAGKPVITATQMLESMTLSARPTRAEVSDVANAVLDGTDAVMLSGETASGKYPVETVTMMARIIAETESDCDFRAQPRLDAGKIGGPAATLAASVVGAFDNRPMDGVVLFTLSGATARLVSNARPNAPIIALTRYADSARRLRLLWGVETEVVDWLESLEALVEVSREVARRRLPRKLGEYMLVAGYPLSERGPSNMMCLLDY